MLYFWELISKIFDKWITVARSRNYIAVFGLNTKVMTDSKSKSFKEGRDTKTGQFVPVKKAREGNPSRYVVEHVPKKGRGDVKK
ncbi:hypothetical protein BH11PAT2_BH11PAT2_05510 [soil metagenome]